MARRSSSHRNWVRTLSNVIPKVKQSFSTAERWAINRIVKAPLASFFTLLGAVLVLIVVGNILRQPKVDTSKVVVPPKSVSVYSIGSSPKVSVSAKVDKSGVVTVVSQTAGIVQGIWVTEGQQVGRGGSLVSLSTNYQGGVLPSLQRQMAQKNYEYVLSVYDTQKDMINKRRDIANTSDTQADDMRNIANQSIGDTQTLISLDQDIVSTLDSQIAQLEAINVNGASDSAILQIKQGKAGIMTGLLSLQNALRNSQYQASEDNSPARLSNLSRELTNAQLDNEQKALDLNKEISELNLKVAQIGESLMYPVSPIAGTVERVYVHVGDAVSPGTVLATIKGSKTTANVIAMVSSDLARRISRLELATIVIGTDRVNIAPRYISTEPTDGSLHSVVFTLPEAYEEAVSNKAYVTVELPVAGAKSLSSIPFVPIDAVYQTQTDAYIFVATSSAQNKVTAVSKSVTLGQMIGSYVEVTKGLESNDQVIMDRVVSSGDPIVLK